MLVITTLEILDSLGYLAGVMGIVLQQDEQHRNVPRAAVLRDLAQVLTVAVGRHTRT